MRAIRFREPPTDSWGLRDIFRVGFSTAIRRAVVIGNGVAGAENQCTGLVRALGLSHRQTIYHVTRPRGGINNWLQWLPVSVHKKLDYAIKRICGDSQFQTIKANKVMSLPTEKNGSAGCLYEELNGNIYTQEEILMFLPSLNEGSAGLSHVLEADAKQIATMAHETFEKDGPLLVVASGWDTISVASSIKRLAPEKVFVVQIQHPRSQLNRFNLVITPRHDYYPLTPEGQEQIPWFLRRWITPREPPDRHVVLTVGALHQADSTALQVAACAWHDELAPLLKPLLVVNIGGPTKHCQYGADLAKQLTASLKNVRWSFGSLRISFSRRTPQEVSDILEKEFSYHPKVYIWDGKDPNPHMGHLAWADAFIITADSVSMLSEACSTGKPVYVIGAERCTWKFADFHKSLQERGVVRPFTGKEDISKRWSYPPLNDTAEASSRVIEALSEHGWRLEP